MDIFKKELKDIIKTMKAKELRMFIECACVNNPEVFEVFMKYVDSYSIKDYVFD